MTTHLPCPCCHASGRITRLDVAIGVTWITWAAFAPTLPDALSGTLLLTWVGLALWRWSGRPPKETPAPGSRTGTPLSQGPFYGTSERAGSPGPASDQLGNDGKRDG
jgi:hypothetical protein